MTYLNKELEDQKTNWLVYLLNLGNNGSIIQK